MNAPLMYGEALAGGRGGEAYYKGIYEGAL